MIAKLKSRSGESLVESLAAILIFTLSSIILFTMVSTAGNINRTAMTLESEVQEELKGVEEGQDYAQNGRGTLNLSMKVDGANEPIANIDMDVYGGKEEGDLYAFYATIPTTTGGDGT